MTRIRVTAVICPSCKGTGKSTYIQRACMWCEGSKRVPVGTALRWADQSEMLGSGGYICGDHDWDDRCRMVSEAEAVRALVGQLRDPS